MRRKTELDLCENREMTRTAVDGHVAAVSKRPLGRRLLRLGLWLGIPLVLLPVLFPRKVSAKGARGTAAGATRTRALPLDETLQRLVDDFRARLTIPNPVAVALVAGNPLLVSVERTKDQADGFTLSLESSFVEDLSDAELAAVVAHELGHVWIFTHHPFLQTEEQANEIALKFVSRDVLERVYDRVWKHTGVKGTLQYLPVE
jgi:hypothetical protein